MDLYLIRHAIAAERGAFANDDARPLTPKGRKRFERGVAGMQRLGLRFDRLYHSPLLRAVQTAELLMPLVDGESVVVPWLAEPPSAGALTGIEGERIALVGHEPWMSQLLSLLLFGSLEQASALPFRKGGIARLEGEPRPAMMRLIALLPPSVLRRLDRRGK